MKISQKYPTMKFLRSISIGSLPDIQQLWSSKLLLLIHASQSNMQESHGHNFLLLFFFKVRSCTQSKHFMKKALCQNDKVNRNSLSALLHPKLLAWITICTTFAGPYMAIKNPTMSLLVVFLMLIQACRGSDNDKFFFVAGKLSSMQLPTGYTRHHQSKAVTVRAWFSDSLMTVTSPYPV